MRLRWALVLIALLPLVLGSGAVAWVVAQRSQVLAGLHLAAVEPVLLAARKAELQSFVNLARSSIQHLVRDGMPDPAAQAQALAILKRLEFGHDGYFFVFDFAGNTLLYPRQPQLQGRNLLDLRDREGGYPIRKLLDQARSGGGYVQYEWARPSTGQTEPKLGYVEPIAGWEWMIGTGTYVDEPERARRRIAEATSDAVVDTLSRIGAITMLTTLAIVALALAINVNEQRKADAAEPQRQFKPARVRRRHLPLYRLAHPISGSIVRQPERIIAIAKPRLRRDGRHRRNRPQRRTGLRNRSPSRRSGRHRRRKNAPARRVRPRDR